ncbi:beta-lactamase/transpeptidase-like protein [Myriangium duriaei CBS 260.36]|uniref:Beta-lactamase/transpeptidase-like protein n=1 Tax=Myriangium duriaei CBS 260.36 TaxID=1168546 RepID=A0A9P4MD09_9PEZI|nr:beta-lactamase/transpeptidase-like protein [Myriangium duriaei CBS 260.36]
MRFFSCLSTAALVGGVVGKDHAQQPLQVQPAAYDPYSKSFDKYVAARINEWHTPGIAIAVIHGDETWTKGYGFADVEAERPVTPYTLFHGASTTKAHTASLVALLVQNNETFKDITWETKLHDVDPYAFQLADPYESAETTFTDALSHRTGMPRHDFSWVNTNASIEDQVRSLRHLPLSAPFRTKWQYCNLMFTAVAHAIEKLTHQAIGKIYTSWLWQPLGMNETYYSNRDAFDCQNRNPSCRLSKHYSWSSHEQKFTEFDIDSVPPMNGAGGIITNINDYAKWIRALTNAGGPVSNDGHRALRNPNSIAYAEKGLMDGPIWYGLGLMGGTYRGHNLYFHGGAIGGYFSKVAFIPDMDWGFVIMQNAPNACLEVVAQRLIDDFLKTPIDDRKDVNAAYWREWGEKVRKIKGQPDELFPVVADPPKLPSVRTEDYAGIYSHPSYGRITLVAGLPSTGSMAARLPRKRDHDHGPTIVLHAQTALLEVVYVFRHVSGENWLIEQWEHEMMDDDVPTGYTKAETVVGADGKVSAIYIITEPSVKGEGAWTEFLKIE